MKLPRQNFLHLARALRAADHLALRSGASLSVAAGALEKGGHRGLARRLVAVRWRAVLVMLSSISSYCIGSCTDLIANTSGAGGLTERRADGNGNKIQASAPGSEPIASARPKHTENSSAFSGATP